MSLWRRIYEERRAIILPLVIVLVVNAAVLGLVVWPLQNSVAAAEVQSAEATAALADARRLEKQAREAQSSKERATQELQKFYGEVLPKNLHTAENTTGLWLTQAAKDAGLVFKGSHFEYTEVRDSRLSRAYTKVTLQGRYPNIRKFLYAVETAQEFIVVERVELAQQGDQPSANGLLEVQLLVATYFLTPQS